MKLPGNERDYEPRLGKGRLGENARYTEWDPVTVGRPGREQEYRLLNDRQECHSYSSNSEYAIWNPERFDPDKVDEKHLMPFDGFRVLWDIQIESYNYLKESHLSGDEVRRMVDCTLLCNREPVYLLSRREVHWTLIAAHEALLKLQELPFRCWKWREEIGRKVDYEKTPCKVQTFYGDQGALILEAGPEAKFIPPVYHESDIDGEWEWEDTIKVDLLDPKIWWFRD